MMTAQVIDGCQRRKPSTSLIMAIQILNDILGAERRECAGIFVTLYSINPLFTVQYHLHRDDEYSSPH